MSEKARSFLELLEDVKKNQTKSLTISGETEILYKIPDEIYELSFLEVLRIKNSYITNIPSKISKLNNLRKLELESESLAQFPIELIGHKSLDELSIKSPILNSIPKELSKWETLTYLNVSDCIGLKSIDGLPPRLSYLNIGRTELPAIPEIVFGLKSIRKLVISGFELSEIPEKIFEMRTIASLFLRDCNISSISSSIKKLTKLKELVLTGNKFTEIPEVVTSLTELTELDFSGNLITSIPESLKNLSNLTAVHFRSNDLSEFPMAFCEMVNLENIGLGNYDFFVDEKYSHRRKQNSIKIVPYDILKLDKLQELDLFKLPIENVPKEILSNDWPAIKDFLQSIIDSDKEEYLCEAKMVVVGRGDVGKSELTRKLTIPNYSLSKGISTPGIDILKSPLTIKIKDIDSIDKFKFTIWDFGGQEKYDATHQLFITNRSLYLFITEARQESNFLDFYYWLNTIRLFSDNSPVIVVMSKCDIRKKQLPELTYKEQFPNIVDFVDVSSADGYEHTIASLTQVIESATKLLPQTKQKLSNKWIDIRNELENLSKKVDYIQYDEYIAICKRNKLNKTQADFLSQYLNDLGTIIHHQSDLLLKKTVFVNTEWCVDGMYKVLDDEIVYKQNGRFTNKDLDKIWHDKRFENKQEELLKLMKEYNLCFEIKDGSGYIAPEMLPPDKPERFIWDTNANMKFEYRYSFMPAGILTRFIVKSHGFIKDEQYWKYGVILQYDNTLALVEEDFTNSKIQISLKGENKKGLLSFIRMTIDEVHRDFDKTNKLSFEEMVPCNCSECVKSDTPHFYKFNVLKRFEQKSRKKVPCDLSSEDVSVKELINDVQLINSVGDFSSNSELKDFICDAISNVLEKQIIYKEGYLSFWRDQECTNPKNEIEIQPYISNVLDAHCKVRGVHLAREVREANGSVDILFTYTNREKEILKVCVEIKKAQHQDIETAVRNQLPEYMRSVGTDAGVYLVVWLKNDSFPEPKKYMTTNDIVAAIEVNNLMPQNISIKTINCTKRTSPSKIK